MSRALLILPFIVALMVPLAAMAQQRRGCFIGRDQLGQPARAYVEVEHYGDWFEIAGVITSAGAGQVYRFKADGHSGAGRLFSGHEYEAGAVYIDVLQLSPSSFVLAVEGYGTFHFRGSPC